MFGMEAWELVLVAVAAYVATTSLVRLMRARRDELIAQLRRQAERERRRQAEREQRRDAA